MLRSEKKGFSGDFIEGPQAQFPLVQFDGSIAATRNCLVVFDFKSCEFWTLTFELEKIESFKIEAIQPNGSYKVVMKYNEVSDTLLVFADGKIINISLDSKTVLWTSAFMDQTNPMYGTNCVGIAVDSRGIIYVCMSRNCPAFLYVLTHNGAVVEKVGKNSSTHRMDLEYVYGMGMDGDENIALATYDNRYVMLKISKMLKPISKITNIATYFCENPLVYDSVKNHFLVSDYNGINVIDMKFNTVSHQTQQTSAFQVALANNGMIYQVCSGGSAYDTIKSFQ